MNIHTLYLRGNNTITNEGIKHMNIHSLILYNNSNITYEGIKHMNLHLISFDLESDLKKDMEKMNLYRALKINYDGQYTYERNKKLNK